MVVADDFLLLALAAVLELGLALLAVLEGLTVICPAISEKNIL
jgi:hypothetical protein